MAARRIAIAIAVILASCNVWAQNDSFSEPLADSTYGADDALGAAGLPPTSGSGDMMSGPSLGTSIAPAAVASYQERSPVSVPAVRSETLAEGFGNRQSASSWYTREEYYHWNERLDGADFVNEYGLLITLGVQKRVGVERFRAELFGGTMNYVGGAQYADGTTEPLSSKTGYLGFRAEGELLFEPDWLPQSSLFLGVGSRFWFRDLKDGVTDSGNPVTGYQEMWWTIYPYLGLESRRTVFGGAELYASGRVGATPVTYEHATWGDAVLYPRCGITGQVEIGLRGQHIHCAAISEVMTWRESPVARGALQPSSMFVTLGLRAGIDF